MTTPPRTIEQRLTALERANAIRRHRARAKVDLGAGRLTLVDVLDDPMFATAKIVDVLVALPKVGRVKAHKVLTVARVSPSKTVGGITRRQRGELLLALPAVAPTAARHIDHTTTTRTAA